MAELKFQRRTKRLVIRPLRLSDYEAWHVAHTTMPSKRSLWDTDARGHKSHTKSYFKKILATQIGKKNKDQSYAFHLFLKDGTLIGFSSLFEISRGISQNAILGYRLYNRHWSQGYAMEAVRAVIDIAFRDLRLHRVEAGIEPRNLRSTRLIKNLNFRKEGVSKRRLFIRNKWLDIGIYALTTEDAGYRFIGEAKR